jgi:O-acetyl-ADP-ribose deacetylase (regulator of RNase III)
MKGRTSLSLSDIRPWSEAAPMQHNGRDGLRPPDAEINARISFLPRGDSTRLQVDAVVNAANTKLSKGNGLCGAIHDAAGSELAIACEEIGGCPTGSAVLTPGFRLPAKYVIHAVGPIGRDDQLLKQTYEACLALIDGQAIRSLGLCCLSVGIYAFPLRPATHIALAAVRSFLENAENRSRTDRIIFVLYDKNEVDTYAELLLLYFPLASTPPNSDSEDSGPVPTPDLDPDPIVIEPPSPPRVISPVDKKRKSKGKPPPRPSFIGRVFRWLASFFGRK